MGVRDRFSCEKFWVRKILGAGAKGTEFFPNNRKMLFHLSRGIPEFQTESLVK